MSSMFQDVIVKMMQSITLDENQNIEVVDEQLKEEADELLGQLVIETARRWWMECESQEDSLAGMEDEVSFDEEHGGRDSLRTPALGKSKKKDEQTVESILGMEEFDVASILEMDDEEDVRDGDDEYDDMLRGDDEMGGENHFDDMDDEDNMDAIGDEHEEIGPEIEGDFDTDDAEAHDDEEFDFSFLNDEDDDIDMGDDFVMHGEEPEMDEPEAEESEDDYEDFEDDE